MTLEQCIRFGIQNNASLEASRLAVEAAGSDVKTVRSDFLPDVSSSYSQSKIISENATGNTDVDYLDQKTGNFNVRLTQMLYSGSKLLNNWQKAKLMEQAMIAEMHLERIELIHLVKMAFYRLMRARQDVITAEESVKRLSESIRSARAFFEKDLVPYVDVLQAEVDLADAREQLGIAKNNVNRERSELFSLMNRNENPAISFTETPEAVFPEIPSLEVCMEQAMAHRPDIKRLKLQMEIADINADISLGKYLPEVRLDLGYYDQDKDYDELADTGTYTYDRDQRNRYWSGGIYISWSLFDGGRGWYEKEKYQVEKRRITALINNLANQIETGIRKALFSMNEASRRMTGSLEALNAAKEYYAMESGRLKAGISTIPNLLDAHYRLIRAQSNRARAVLDYQLAESELKRMMGDTPPVAP